MRFSCSTSSSVLGVLISVASAYVPESTIATDQLAASSLVNLAAAISDGSLQETLAGQNVSQTCDITTAAVRKEYSTLSNDEKLNYTNAVLCMMAKPAMTPVELVPGVRSRYDDFVATHVNQTLTIHGTGNFLSWHRYFLWSWETALREECGYAGYQPYWNWGKSAQDPINSPYMDGSEYSQGGNGDYEAHNCTPALPTGLNCVPPGDGGGCMTTGPYAGVLANISATSPTLQVPEVVAGAFLGYQPRCIRRDISPWVSQRWSGDNESYDIITNPTWSDSIGPFQTHLQGNFTAGYFGLHTAGHFTCAGDPGGDIFNSPNDPLFWLHHGQIDRTWWIWQNQDVTGRAFQISGTITLNNSPPSANTTLEDDIDLGFVAPGLAIKNHVSTVGGPYCYIYV